MDTDDAVDTYLMARNGAEISPKMIDKVRLIFGDRVADEIERIGE